MMTAIASLTLSVSLAGDTGGVPAQIAALQNAVAALQTQLVNVKSANSILQSQVTGLQSQVSQLQATVSSNDTALQNQIAGLQNQQNLLDGTVTVLQSQNQIFIGRGGGSGPLLANYVNMPPPVDASVSVPAGSYLIHANIAAFNLDKDDQTGECALSTASNAFTPKGGFAPNDATVRIPGMGSPLNTPTSWDAQIPLLDSATFTSDTQITVSCTGFNWIVTPTIVAVSVGNIH